MKGRSIVKYNLLFKVLHFYYACSLYARVPDRNDFKLNVRNEITIFILIYYYKT